MLLDNLVIAQTLSKDIRQKATDEARSYLYDLRHTPQPSGETREAVARVEALIEDLTYAAMPTKPDVVTLCGSTASQARDDLRAILALLSARPLVLGGQQGEDEDWIRGLIGEAIVMNEDQERADEGDEELSRISDGVLKALRPYLSTTPARAEAPYGWIANAVDGVTRWDREKSSLWHEGGDEPEPATLNQLMLFAERGSRAEAQDEGAAGEPTREQWLWAAKIVRELGPSMSPGAMAMTMERLAGKAHPSPTPAADADRVRIAVEALERDVRALCVGYPNAKIAWPHRELHEIADRLAALKSTAAKEGGE